MPSIRHSRRSFVRSGAMGLVAVSGISTITPLVAARSATPEAATDVSYREDRLISPEERFQIAMARQ